MKSFYAVAFALSAAVASAQLDGLSPCVQGCVMPFIGKGVPGCVVGDFKCVCENKAFLADITKCVTEKCTADDLETAGKFAADTCANVGVTISVPTPSAAAPGPTATTTTTITTAYGNETINGNVTSTSRGTSTPTASNEPNVGTSVKVGGFSIIGGAIAAFLFL